MQWKCKRQQSYSVSQYPELFRFRAALNRSGRRGTIAGEQRNYNLGK